MKIPPALSINKKYHSHQQFLGSKCEGGLPPLWSSRCCHPPPHGDCWGAVGGNARSKVNTETGLAPDNWDAYETNEFSEPRDLHFPIHRRINSLTWYLVFDIQTGCSLCCKLVYSLISPASLEQFSQAAEILSPGLGVLNITTK